MSGSVLVREPGEIIRVQYERGRDKQTGKYPVIVAGTIAEQVQEAQDVILRTRSSYEHEMFDLFTMAEDCPHSDPEEDEKYADVEDLIEAWMLRNTGLNHATVWGRSSSKVLWDLWYRNRKRAVTSVPLAAEFDRAESEYQGTHNTVCLLSPAGSACRACTEGDDDSGYEDAPCWRHERAREDYAEFWWRFSTEGFEDRARQEAAHA